MDARSNLIIAKGNIVTDEISDCVWNPATDRMEITYKNGKTYDYASRNVTWLKNPVSLDPQMYQIRRKGKPFDHVTAIFSFRGGPHEYFHVCFANGVERSYDKKDLEIRKSCLANESAERVFSYLRQVAERVSVQAEDGTAILREQYGKIGFMGEDTAIAVYLNPAEYASSSGLLVEAPIFPFGCNKSQFQAVQSALSNRISVIEGPPGTGKTLTILNLIANLVMNGKTVQIVSNNNSAVENILEKLSAPEYGLDFFVASLGRMEKKLKFLQEQTGRLPDLRAFADGSFADPAFYETVRDRSVQLGNIFEKQNQLALLRQELQRVSLEQAHYREIGDSVEGVLPLRKAFSSQQLMQCLLECENAFDRDAAPGFLSRFRFRIKYGLSLKSVLGKGRFPVETALQSRYYEIRKNEIGNEICRLEKELEQTNADRLLAGFTEDSLACFRAHLASRYSAPVRCVFEMDDLWKDPSAFLKEYPVVLSTNYTARSSLGKNALFDFVIMDEASQVDVATGALALSCARNAVIVGDTRQLSNIVTNEQKRELQAIFESAQIADAYSFTENSFLDSVLALFEERIPCTVLKEHYRCDPQIIGYCNRKFYQDELVVMTEGTENAIRLYTTNAGSHARERSNLRQAEMIRDEILPALNVSADEMGIITPYRNQADLLRRLIEDPAIEIDTIHKFQGREKDAIIFSTSDDIVTAFSDNPNLLNVAVSRAKKIFLLVASEEEQPQNSNVGDLIGYILYNSCDVSHSAIRSVFDYLYAQYETQRLAFLKKHKRVSDYDSENLMFGLIEDVLEKIPEPLGVVAHLPLYQLIRERAALSEEEIRFIETGLSHLDFLIYNSVTKKPVLAIEVDGYWYHKEGSRQAERDRLKNHILETVHIPLIRFSTNGSGEKEKLESKLGSVLSAKN